eukprot:gb/GFBE01077339.1/.p1 GENE.gb/GFBE01077339.1/~~gb/GFBE01077339.1/.p1  ORF type:complete len:440 (+),score=80.99 gb/GFBE01077339.1/:1-1320(+)
MLLLLAPLSLLLHPGAALDNGLALTPPMGWRSWNYFKGNIDQITMLAQVEAMATRRHGNPSLLELGYSQVGLDDAWQACGAGVNRSFHNESGYPIINTTRFPDMKAMTDYAHRRGVKIGWYSNNCMCREEFTQPGGNAQQDADMTALLGFDGNKVDGCGPNLDMFSWASAFNKTGRPILVEDCLNKEFWDHGLQPESPTAKIIHECPSNFYRISSDIAPQFMSAMFNVNFGQTLVAPYQNRTHPASRPGCWTYPDMLQVGHKLSILESKTHFALWCITSAPLILGFDLADHAVYDAMYPIVANKRALEINQRWAGWPGSLVKNSTEYFRAKTERGASARAINTTTETYPSWQIWSKPQPRQGNSHQEAVLIVNLSPHPQNVTLTYADVSSAFGDRVFATDVWTGKALQLDATQHTFQEIAPHDSHFLMLSSVPGTVIFS